MCGERNVFKDHMSSYNTCYYVGESDSLLNVLGNY